VVKLLSLHQELLFEGDPMNTEFATGLYDKLVGTHADENLFLSPFSIRVALAMCAAGARGKTRQEMIDLLGIPESIEEQNLQFAALMKSVSGMGERHLQLTTANALWGQQGFNFNPDYEKAVAEFYDGVFHEVNFRAEPDKAVKTINSWAREKTREKIKELVKRDSINDDTRLILTNAIYFKAQWEKVFEKDDTRDEEWYGPKTCKVPMMHQQDSFLYFEGDDFQALHLPYKGRQLNLLVVLPGSKDGLASLEHRWATQNMFQQVANGLDPETVIVSIPRFKIEAEFKLKSVLCDMQADLPFSDFADFSGIADVPFKISEVVHKAFVEVNEEGTEAAAATAAVMWLSTGLGSRPPEPKVFRADHPFLFFIWSRKTNTVFFSGRLLDPA
jgi:serpin B